MDEDKEPASLTRLERRLVDAAVDLMDGHTESPEFMHSVLCQVGLPRAPTEARMFERNNGTSSIVIEAGRLYRRGKWVEQPLPFGAKPRLVLLHVCSEAIRTRSPDIQIGRSAREFLTHLGLDNGGHEYARFRAQIEALVACRMILGMSTDTQDITINTQPISHFEAWVQHDDRSLGLWPGFLRLSGEFFDTLLDHAVPLDPRAIYALKGSALALDVYAWLAHRLCRVRKAEGVKLSWANLRGQFGQEYRSGKNFKQEFKAALIKMKAVYPDAEIVDEIGGLRLYSSPPPIRKVRGVVRLPARS